MAENSGPPPSIGASRHDRYIVVHAVFGSLATLILVPGAVLIARYGRMWRHWNKAHIILNALTAIFIIITFALGNAALEPESDEYSGPSADLHHQLGLSIFIITMVQTILGIGAAFTKHPTFNYVTIQKHRHLLRYVHIVFGIATAAILYAQVYTGFNEWNQASESETTVPKGIKIAFWVLFAVEVFAYAAGWLVMEPLAHRKRKAYVEQNGVEKEPRQSEAGLLRPV